MKLKPISRLERILSGEDEKPITRLEWFIKNAMNSGGGGGSTGLIYDIPFTVTQTESGISATTEAILSDAIAAIKSGKIVRGVATFETGDIGFFDVLSYAASETDAYIAFGRTSYDRGPLFNRVVWDHRGVFVEVLPLAVMGG